MASAKQSHLARIAHILLIASALWTCSSKAEKPPSPSPASASASPAKDAPSAKPKTAPDAGALPDMSNHFWAPCRYSPPRTTGGDDELRSPLFNEELVREQVRTKRQAIRECYEKELLVEPSLAGVVALRAWIEKGQVLRVAASGLNANVAECVRSAFAELVFPKNISGPIGYPFRFSSAGEAAPIPTPASVVWNEDRIDAALKSAGGVPLAACFETLSNAGRAGRAGLRFEVDASGQITTTASTAASEAKLKECMSSASAALELVLDPNEFRSFQCPVSYGKSTVPSDAPVLHLSAQGVSWDGDTWKWDSKEYAVEARSERAAVARGLVDENATGLLLDGVDPRRALVILRIDDDVRVERIGEVMGAFHYPPMWSFVIEAREKDSWVRLHQPVVLPDRATTVLLKFVDGTLLGGIHSIFQGASSEGWSQIPSAAPWAGIESLASANSALVAQLAHDRASIKLWSPGRFAEIRELLNELAPRAGSLDFAYIEPEPLP